MQTQKIWITFAQRRPNGFNIGLTLYKCYTNVLCLLGAVCHQLNFEITVTEPVNSQQQGFKISVVELLDNQPAYSKTITITEPVNSSPTGEQTARLKNNSHKTTQQPISQPTCSKALK